MPVMKPSNSAVNLTPNSPELVSPLSMVPGVVDELQIEHGQSCAAATTEMPAEGVSRLPLSSTARLFRFAVPETCGCQGKVQLSRPLAGCQVWPPSADTSTPPTTPPPTSAAVPLTLMVEPAETEEPAAGEVIVECGAVASVDFVAGSRPG